MSGRPGTARVHGMPPGQDRAVECEQPRDMELRRKGLTPVPLVGLRTEPGDQAVVAELFHLGREVVRRVVGEEQAVVAVAHEFLRRRALGGDYRYAACKRLDCRQPERLPIDRREDEGPGPAELLE